MRSSIESGQIRYEVALSEKAKCDLEWFAPIYIRYSENRDREPDEEFCLILRNLLNGFVYKDDLRVLAGRTHPKGTDVYISNLGVKIDYLKNDPYYIDKRIDSFSGEILSQLNTSWEKLLNDEK